MATQLTIVALGQVLAWTGYQPGAILHSGRCSQYAAHAYQNRHKENGIKQTMVSKRTAVIIPVWNLFSIC
jgi:transposase InsO family protein